MEVLCSSNVQCACSDRFGKDMLLYRLNEARTIAWLKVKVWQAYHRTYEWLRMAHETSYWVRWQARRLAKVFAARRWKTGNLAAKSAAFAMSSVVARPAEMDDESKTGSTPPDAPTCRTCVASLQHRDGVCDKLCRLQGRDWWTRCTCWLSMCPRIGATS